MKLKEYLKNNNISQTDLAKNLNIRKQTINSQLKYWEKNGTPTMKTIKKWSSALNISSEYFIKLISK